MYGVTKVAGELKVSGKNSSTVKDVLVGEVWGLAGTLDPLAWATLDGPAIDGIGFLPCWLKPDGRVFPVDPASDDGKAVVDYVAKGCSSQGLNGRIEAGGIELAGHASVRVVPN